MTNWPVVFKGCNMTFLSRFIMLMIMTLSFAAPAGAAVTSMDIAGACDVIAAEDDKKSEDDKKPEGEEEEPECE
jgi:hypothetical protein